MLLCTQHEKCKHTHTQIILSVYVTCHHRRLPVLFRSLGRTLKRVLHVLCARFCHTAQLSTARRMSPASMFFSVCLPSISVSWSPSSLRPNASTQFIQMATLLHLVRPGITLLDVLRDVRRVCFCKLVAAGFLICVQTSGNWCVHIHSVPCVSLGTFAHAHTKPHVKLLHRYNDILISVPTINAHTANDTHKFTHVRFTGSRSCKHIQTHSRQTSSLAFGNARTNGTL